MGYTREFFYTSEYARLFALIEARNEYYKTVFNQGLNEIDSLLVEKGKKYLNA